MAKKTSSKNTVAEAVAPVADAPVQAPVAEPTFDYSKVYQNNRNEVRMVGYLGKNPVEGKQTANGIKVAKFSISKHQDRRLPNGTISKKSRWWMVRAYGKTAEIAMAYLRKGRKVEVTGSLDSFDVIEQGVTKTITVINAFRIDFLDDKRPEDAPAAEAQVQGEVQIDVTDPDTFPF